MNKAVIFNKFVVPQSINESSDDPGFDINPTSATGVSPSIDSITIDSGKIYDTLKSLKVDKACGPDGIGNKILKSCANNLVEPLQLKFQRSLNAGCFPSQWKKANVILFSKRTIRACYLITDQSHYCLVYQKLLNGKCITNYTIFANNTISSLIKIQVSKKMMEQ